jgi:hypothetical protein
MHHDVSIRGGYQSDFARNSSKRGSMTTLGNVAGDCRVVCAEPFGAKDFRSSTATAVGRVVATAQG